MSTLVFPAHRTLPKGESTSTAVDRGDPRRMVEFLEMANSDLTTVLAVESIAVHVLI